MSVGSPWRPMRALLLILLIAPLAGCLDGTAPDDAVVEPVPVPETAGPDVVVAVIDTGIDPYHAHFQGEGLNDAQLSRFVDTLTDESPRRVQLSTGEGALEADAALWADIAVGELVYFEGTRVLGISFGHSADQLPVYDEGGHGTGTSGAVLNAFPEGIVVMVEGTGDADGEAWAASQPWIDILSESYGPPGSVPKAGTVFGLTTSEANKLAWDNGKLPVGAADNTPSLAPNDETAGPPWVIGVAGDDPDAQCREHRSGTFPDVTADFTQDLPEAGTGDGYRSMSGTSFATPTTAGTLAAVLGHVRAAWADTDGITGGALATSPDGAAIANTDVRDALYRAAAYFGTEACVGTATPVNPAAPWLQMGWGHVGPDAVEPAALHLLGEEELPEKPAEAVLFQDAVMAYREALWST